MHIGPTALRCPPGRAAGPSDPLHGGMLLRRRCRLSAGLPDRACAAAGTCRREGAARDSKIPTTTWSSASAKCRLRPSRRSTPAVKENKPLPHAMGDAQPFDTAAGKAYLSRAGGPNSGPKNNRIAIIVSDGKIAGYIAVDVPEAAAKDLCRPGDPPDAGLDDVARRGARPKSSSRMLPFKVSELSGFKKVRTLVPGQAVHAARRRRGSGAVGRALCADLGRAGFGRPAGRPRAARAAVRRGNVPGIRDGRISELPSRCGSAAPPATKSASKATSLKGDKPVTVVQWLRFGGGRRAADHRRLDARGMAGDVHALPRGARRHRPAVSSRE